MRLHMSLDAALMLVLCALCFVAGLNVGYFIWGI